MSFGCQIIAPILEIGVAESNGDAGILTRSSEIAVFAHAQYKFGLKQPRTTGATSCGLQVAMHSQLPRFLVFSFNSRFYGNPVCSVPASVIWSRSA